MDIDVGAIVDTVIDMATSAAGAQGTEETDEPGLFEVVNSIAEAADFDFVSILGDVGSVDLFSSDGLSDVADSFANVIDTVLSGSDSASLLDVSNIGSVVKGLAEELGQKLIDESSITQESNDSIAGLIKSSVMSNVGSLLTDGTINIAGMDISASGLLEFSASMISDTAGAAGNVLSSVVSGSVDLLNGDKTLNEAVNEIIQSIKTNTEDLQAKKNDGLAALSTDGGYDADSLSEVFSEFFTSSVETFVSSFVTNGIKTAVSNPATLANPEVFLATALTTTLSDKNFQTKMLGNLNYLVTGEKTTSSTSSTSSTLSLDGFIGLISNGNTLQGLISAISAAT